jgi:hypothetical protein
MKTKNGRIYAIILAVIAWFAIILQFCHSSNVFNTISFFTIQTNLLVAISMTVWAIFPDTILGRYFSRMSVQSAIMIYIIVVGLGYNIAIRPYLGPETTAGFIYNNVLHVVTPIMFVIFWALYVKKGTLKWLNGFIWLIYPLCYFVYTIVRGSITKWYPYPFSDLNKLTGAEFARNALIGLVLFLFFGVIVIAIDRTVGKNIATKMDQLKDK